MPPRLGAMIAVVFWGISFVATKAALRDVGPVALIFTRVALGAGLLVIIQSVRGKPVVPPRNQWRPVLGMAFIGVFVHLLLQAYGLAYTSAVNTGWLIALTPLWSAILSAWATRERFGTGKIIGLCLGFAGALVVVTGGKFDRQLLSLPSSRGDFLILVSTLNWAFYSVMSQRTLRAVGTTVATTASMAAGALMLLPVFLITGGYHDYARLTAESTLALVFLGFACSALGYLFWFGALSRIEAGRVASFLYIEPLVTLAAAAALIHEEIKPQAVVGGILVLVGVIVVQRAKA